MLLGRLFRTYFEFLVLHCITTTIHHRSGLSGAALSCQGDSQKVKLMQRVIAFYQQRDHGLADFGLVGWCCFKASVCRMTGRWLCKDKSNVVHWTGGTLIEFGTGSWPWAATFTETCKEELGHCKRGGLGFSTLREWTHSKDWQPGGTVLAIKGGCFLY